MTPKANTIERVRDDFVSGLAAAGRGREWGLRSDLVRDGDLQLIYDQNEKTDHHLVKKFHSQDHLFFCVFVKGAPQVEIQSGEEGDAQNKLIFKHRDLLKGYKDRHLLLLNILACPPSAPGFSPDFSGPISGALRYLTQSGRRFRKNDRNHSHGIYDSSSASDGDGVPRAQMSKLRNESKKLFSRSRSRATPADHLLSPGDPLDPQNASWSDRMNKIVDCVMQEEQQEASQRGGAEEKCGGRRREGMGDAIPSEDFGEFHTFKINNRSAHHVTLLNTFSDRYLPREMSKKHVEVPGASSFRISPLKRRAAAKTRG